MSKLQPLRKIAIAGMATMSSDFKLSIEVIEDDHDTMATVNISLEMLQLSLFFKDLTFYRQDILRLERSLVSGLPIGTPCVEDVDGSILITSRCQYRHLVLELSWDAFYPWVKDVHVCNDPASGSKLCIKGLLIGSCITS